MNEYQRAVYRTADLINLGHATAARILGQPTVPIVSADRANEFAAWTMCADDVTGFLAAEIYKIRNSSLPGTPYRLGMECCCDRIRTALAKGLVHGTDTADCIRHDVAYTVEMRLGALQGAKR